LRGPEVHPEVEISGHQVAAAAVAAEIMMTTAPPIVTSMDPQPAPTTG
jgi:hypothetical protein